MIDPRNSTGIDHVGKLYVNQASPPCLNTKEKFLNSIYLNVKVGKSADGFRAEKESGTALGKIHETYQFNNSSRKLDLCPGNKVHMPNACQELMYTKVTSITGI